jgi:hypothetical protein
MPDQKPRLRALVDVVAEDYDGLARAARRHAVALLGPDRPYWLDLGDARPDHQDHAGDVHSWRATVVIVFPSDPPF